MNTGCARAPNAAQHAQLPMQRSDNRQRRGVLMVLLQEFCFTGVSKMQRKSQLTRGGQYYGQYYTSHRLRPSGRGWEGVECHPAGHQSGSKIRFAAPLQDERTRNTESVHVQRALPRCVRRASLHR